MLRRHCAPSKGALLPCGAILLCLAISGASLLKEDAPHEVDHRAATAATIDEESFTDVRGYLLATPEAVPAFQSWNAEFYRNDPDMRMCLNSAFAIIGGVTLSQAEESCRNSMAEPAQSLAAVQ